jgi:hypothetical protein
MMKTILDYIEPGSGMYICMMVMVSSQISVDGKVITSIQPLPRFGFTWRRYIIVWSPDTVI